MSVDCIQMSARIGFALRSLVRPISETITLDTLVFYTANALFQDGRSGRQKYQHVKTGFAVAIALLRARLPRVNKVSYTNL